MKAMRVRHPASLDNLVLETAEAPPPGPREIKVRIRAASLNFRDGPVVNGFFPVKDGLIPHLNGRQRGELPIQRLSLVAQAARFREIRLDSPAGLIL